MCFPGFKKGRTVDLCQQAGCERLHVCGWDLPEPPTYLNKRPSVAHPGLLRSHRGGVRTPSNTRPARLVVVVFLTQYSELVPLFHIPIPLWHIQCLVYLQVVPGARVDDVKAACEMMTFDSDQECALALRFSASRHEHERRMGGEDSGWTALSSFLWSCRGRYILLW